MVDGETESYKRAQTINVLLERRFGLDLLQKLRTKKLS